MQVIYFRLVSSNDRLYILESMSCRPFAIDDGHTIYNSQRPPPMGRSATLWLPQDSAVIVLRAKAAAAWSGVSIEWFAGNGCLNCNKTEMVLKA